MNITFRHATAHPRSGWVLAAWMVVGLMSASSTVALAATNVVPVNARTPVVSASTAPSAAQSSPPVAPSPTTVGAAAASGARTTAAEDIRDIRPPYPMPPGWLWLAWAGAGCAVLAIAYALWRWRHRLPGLRPKLPFELALEELEMARALMQPEHAREFSIRVSEIVRRYIEVRFAARAAHRTTEEFLHDCLMDQASPLVAHRELLGNFLHHCDLAKFARWVLAVPEMEAMLQSASTFVRNTGLETAPAVLARGASSTDSSDEGAAGKTSTLEPQPS